MLCLIIRYHGFNKARERDSRFSNRLDSSLKGTSLDPQTYSEFVAVLNCMAWLSHYGLLIWMCAAAGPLSCLSSDITIVCKSFWHLCHWHWHQWLHQVPSPGNEADAFDRGSNSLFKSVVSWCLHVYESTGEQWVSMWDSIMQETMALRLVLNDASAGNLKGGVVILPTLCSLQYDGQQQDKPDIQCHPEDPNSLDRPLSRWCT